jgi:hypothetical protein
MARCSTCEALIREVNDHLGSTALVTDSSMNLVLKDYEYEWGVGMEDKLNAMESME